MTVVGSLQRAWNSSLMVFGVLLKIMYGEPLMKAVAQHGEGLRRTA